MSPAHNNAHLHRPRGDVHTTRTFTALETMPILTDLDPPVNSEWAASKVNPPTIMSSAHNCKIHLRWIGVVAKSRQPC